MQQKSKLLKVQVLLVVTLLTVLVWKHQAANYYAKSRERAESLDDFFDPFDRTDPFERADRAEVTDPGGDGSSAPNPNSTEDFCWDFLEETSYSSKNYGSFREKKAWGFTLLHFQRINVGPRRRHWMLWCKWSNWACPWWYRSCWVCWWLSWRGTWQPESDFVDCVIDMGRHFGIGLLQTRHSSQRRSRYIAQRSKSNVGLVEVGHVALSRSHLTL